MNNQDIVNIDETALDKECIRQPSLYAEVSAALSDAKLDMDETKREYDVAQAEMYLKVRSDPGAFDLEKPTETAISATITSNEVMQKFHKRMNHHKHKVDTLQNLIWALEHKKRSLTLLVDLHTQGYFSAPPVSKEGREAVEERVQKDVRTKRRLVRK